MIDAALAALGLLAVILIPGWALSYAAAPSWPWWAHASAAPASGVGAVFLAMVVADSGGLPLRWGWAVLAAGALAGAAWRGRSRMRAARPAATAAGRGSPARMGIGLLVAATLIAAVLWALSLHGMAVPPNYDSAHHGLFTARITEGQTLDVEVVTAALATQESGVTSFYPLGLHGASSLVHELTQVAVGRVWLALTVLFGAVVWPIGLYALGRQLLPQRPLVAGTAAVLGVLAALFPYKPIAWGGMVLIAGMAMSLGAAVALWRAAARSSGVGAIAVAVLAVFGVAVTHTSELAVVLGLIGLLLLERILRGEAAGILLVTARVALMLTLAAALLLAAVPSLIVGLSERAAFDDRPPIPLSDALAALWNLSVATPAAAPILGVAAMGGTLVALLRRRGISLVIAAAGVVIIYAAASSMDGGLLVEMSAPFYRQPERIAYILMIIAPLLAALLVDSAIELIESTDLRRRAVALTASVLIVAMVAGGIALGASDIPSMVRLFFAQYSPITGPELAVIDHLAGSDEVDRVLTDRNADGSLWLYALADVDPVFLNAPTAASTFEPSAEHELAEAEWLRRNIQFYYLDPQVRAAVERLGISHVYFDGSGFLGSPRLIDAERLSVDPHFPVEASQGDATVYGVRDAVGATRTGNLLQDPTFSEPRSRWEPDDGGEWQLRQLPVGSCIQIGDTAQATLTEMTQSNQWEARAPDRLTVRPGEVLGGRLVLAGDPLAAGSVHLAVHVYDWAGESLGWYPTATITAEGGPASTATGSLQLPPDAAVAQPMIVVQDLAGSICIAEADLYILLTGSSAAEAALRGHEPQQASSGVRQLEPRG